MGAAIATAVASFGLSYGSAEAATTECTSGNVTFFATQGAPNAILDHYCGLGNDKNTVPFGTFFGQDGWTLGSSTDTDDGDKNVVVSVQSPNSQTWSFTGGVFPFMALGLKQGNHFALFQLDPTKPLSGTWATSGPGGSTNALSHASAFYVIPLPAAGWLLLGGLGALGALGSRRRKQAA